ncbi:hypothetical protein M3629_03690 [Paenibacillus polysaccharolyticus]|uniref:hypothetical protein n=1 Tax=Paenibacillus polysaccharolyticus TaxID=582692 RepID=UPI00203B7B71|nr:hypothetical protein [Paenibacillus polysaccharolyticus]MCM3131870.1 hypothetical protein [Paenibacillus polysaccharolyticus]
MDRNDMNVIFDVTPDSIRDSMKLIPRLDRMFVVAPFAGQASIHAPVKTGKYKGYHRIKCEILIPEDDIKGDGILEDFGAFAVLSVPKARVADHLKRAPKEGAEQ